jgi:hypothetical protein
MPCLYIVRCNFARQDLEAAWNGWYDGVKLDQMLAKPMFLSGQRFRAVALNTYRKYLALWVVDSAAAFETPEYKADWGFAEWAEHITDWTRDLYHAPGRDFAVAADETLYVASSNRIQPGATWMECIGLDRSAHFLALKRLKRGETPPSIPGVGATVFAPITSAKSAVRASSA